jgi:hypothetical protein
MYPIRLFLNKNRFNLSNAYSFSTTLWQKYWQIPFIYPKTEVKGKISGRVKALRMKNIYIFVASYGGLAQLARAFDWQSKGHRFDSDILH